MGKRDRSSSPERHKKSSKHGKESSKRKRRSRSESSGSGTDSDAPAASKLTKEERRAAKLAEKLQRKREERRSKETPAERAARKAAEKQNSTAARFGYTNDVNPFGDSNLEAQFVWQKKGVKEGTSTTILTKKQQAAAHQAKLEEIEKVRKRREESEREKEEFERLQAEEGRLREQQQYGDWQRKEEEFHLEQAKTRSKIRLVEGRQRPVDLVAKNLLIFGDDAPTAGGGGSVRYISGKELDTSNLEMELREPYKLCEGLTLSELEELERDVRAYQSMEDVQTTPMHTAFWAALGVVCTDELQRAREMAGLLKDSSSSSSSAAAAADSAASTAAAAGVHKAVRDDVAALFGDRDVARLSELREQIEARIAAGSGDVDYWGEVLKHLHVHQAKARLRELHETMLQRQLDKLEALREERAQRRAAAIEAGEPLPEDLLQSSSAAAAAAGGDSDGEADAAAAGGDADAKAAAMVQAEARKGMEDLEDAMGLGKQQHYQHPAIIPTETVRCVYVCVKCW
jgi:Conserved mid region of cactin